MIRFLFTAVLCLFAFNANALTVVTFNHISNPIGSGVEEYVEKGVTLTGSDLRGTNQWLRLPYDSGPESTFTLTYTPLFSLVRLAIGSQINPDCNVNGGPCAEEWPILKIEGFLGGVKTGEAIVTERSHNNNITFGPEFGVLDSIIFTALGPSLNYFDLGGDCGSEPCSITGVHQIYLTPIPLPAGLPLFAAGLGIVALIRRVKG